MGDGKILLGGSLLVILKKEFISHGYPKPEEKQNFNPEKYPNNVLEKSGLKQFMKSK